MFRRSDKLEFLLPRERFIPVQVPALVERLTSDPELSPEERGQLRQLAHLLQARFHFEFLQAAEKLKEFFDPFNPDRDTLLIRDLTEAESEAYFSKFCELLHDILIKSNYTKLSREELIRCLEAENPWGVRVEVDLSRYKVIDFYYRGIKECIEPCQRWYFWRPVPRRFRRFSRIVVVVRLAPEAKREYGDASSGFDQVLLKLFKDVRLEELKMTSPHIRIRIRLWDKVQIAVSVVATLVTSIVRLVVAAAVNPVLFFSVLSGCAIAAAKAVQNFITCRIRYMERLGANLYSKLLASNVAAISRLFDTAEAEEVKEALLAYYILYKYRDRDLTMQEADELTEAWLNREFGLPHVDFEIEDGLRKLREKDLLVERLEPAIPVVSSGLTSGNTAAGVLAEGLSSASSETVVVGDESRSKESRVIYKVYDLPSALRRLDEWWDNYFLYANVGRPEDNHIAGLATVRSSCSEAPPPEENPNS
jgi:hypothetical protein